MQIVRHIDRRLEGLTEHRTRRPIAQRPMDESKHTSYERGSTTDGRFRVGQRTDKWQHTSSKRGSPTDESKHLLREGLLRTNDDCPLLPRKGLSRTDYSPMASGRGVTTDPSHVPIINTYPSFPIACPHHS